MDERISARLAQATVLLDRQYRLLERIYADAQETLERLRAAMDSASPGFDAVLDVYAQVLSLIDNFARYQKTALSIPGLSQKSPEHRAFAAAMGNIVDARNQLQHLNNDIENENTGPLLGGVAWVKDKRNYVVALNDIGRKRSVPGIPFDTKNLRYVSDFCFAYGNSLFDLAKAMNGVREFNRYIYGIVRIEIDGIPYVADQHFMAVSSTILTGAEVEALERDQQAKLTAQTSETSPGSE
jgi:hypothetical protein